MPCASLSAFLLFSFLSWLAATKPILSCFVFFSLSPSLPRFPHYAHKSSGFPFAYSPLLHSPRSCPSYSVLVPILRSLVSLHPRCRSRSVPFPINVHVPVPAPGPVPVFVSVPVSCPAPEPVRLVPDLAPGYPLGLMCVYRPRALRMELSGARKRHPWSAEMMTCAERKELIASTRLVWFLALVRLSCAYPDPVLVPVPIFILCSSTGYHPRPRSVPASFPLPSPLPFGVPFFASTLVLVPASIPLPSPFTSPCSTPTPFPCPIPLPTSILPPILFATSRSSALVTPSV